MANWHLHPPFEGIPFPSAQPFLGGGIFLSRLTFGSCVAPKPPLSLSGGERAVGSDLRCEPGLYSLDYVCFIKAMASGTEQAKNRMIRRIWGDEVDILLAPDVSITSQLIVLMLDGRDPSWRAPHWLMGMVMRPGRGVSQQGTNDGGATASDSTDRSGRYLIVNIERI